MKFLTRLFKKKKDDEIDRELLKQIMIAFSTALTEGSLPQSAELKGYLNTDSEKARLGIMVQFIGLCAALQAIDEHCTANKTELSSLLVKLALMSFSDADGISIENHAKLFEYVRTHICNGFEHKSQQELGLNVLSVIDDQTEAFPDTLIRTCALVAFEAWGSAKEAVEAIVMSPSDSSDSGPVEYADAWYDRLTYLLNYSKHYAPLLAEHLTRRAVCELFMFRAWATQFGCRIFSTTPEVSEQLIGEIINSCKYIGLGVFQNVQGFSIEETLGDDFISLVEDRWRDYDVIVSTDLKRTGIPTDGIIDVLMHRIGLVDTSVRYSLSIDFLSLLDSVKAKAMEKGWLDINKTHTQ